MGRKGTEYYEEFRNKGYMRFGSKFLPQVAPSCPTKSETRASDRWIVKEVGKADAHFVHPWLYLAGRTV
jgi:hypothetical protein